MLLQDIHMALTSQGYGRHSTHRTPRVAGAGEAVWLSWSDEAHAMREARRTKQAS
jgi:hypothetical protein